MKLKDGQILITPTRNGAKVDDEEGASVYEFSDDNIAGLCGMLYDIGDQCFPGCQSRYNAERIRVCIIHGDKHTCGKKKNECVTCRLTNAIETSDCSDY